MTVIVHCYKIFVQASQKSVFDYIADLTRHPEWSGGQLEIQVLTPGPVEVGNEYLSHGTDTVQKERANRIRISRYDSPHLFSFVASDPNLGDVTHEFKLTKIQDTVQIERVVTFSLNPWKALTFRLVVYPFIGKPAMDRSMLLLQKRLERQYALIL